MIKSLLESIFAKLWQYPEMLNVLGHATAIAINQTQSKYFAEKNDVYIFRLNKYYNF